MGVPIDANKRHCALHGITYGKLEQCSGCRASQSIAVKSQSPKADTRELELREGEYREADKYLRRIGREWLDDGTAQERNVALKAFDAASKWARLAYEIRQYRLEIEHDQWLREQKMILGGSDN